jgi:hypothetical protein
MLMMHRAGRFDFWASKGITSATVEGDSHMIVRPLFPIGAIYGTPGALQLLEDCQVSPDQLLLRHVAGDWGSLDSEDTATNNAAVSNGSRLLSNYRLCGVNGSDCGYDMCSHRLWIITEADRSSTTLLLPEDY